MDVESTSAVRPLCLAAADRVFGPRVAPCRRSFDFTFLFEELILCVGPSALFLLLGLGRWFVLRNQKVVRACRRAQNLKLLSIFVLAILQLVLLVLWSTKSDYRTPSAIASAALLLMISILMYGISHIEHTRSSSPSTLLTIYLFFAIQFEAVRIRSMWLSHYDGVILGVFTTSFVLKIVVLILEAQSDRTSLISNFEKESPEESCSVFSHTLVLWLNGLLVTGYGKTLSLPDLFSLIRGFNSEILDEKVSHGWQNSTQQGNHVLFDTLWKTFTWLFLAPIPPVTVGVALNLTQALLINAVLDYMKKPETADQNSIGYGLIGAYALVYTGSAVSTSWTEFTLNRLQVVLRGALVSLIYKRTTEINLNSTGDLESVTLMNSDVENIVNGLIALHGIWAAVLQVGIGLWLLQRQLGLAFLPPLGVSIVVAVGTLAIAGAAEVTQTGWLNAMQKRIGATTKMLSAMKGVKFSGLTQLLTSILHQMRIDEIAAASKFRAVLLYAVTFANVPETIGPLLSFAAYIGIRKHARVGLDAARIFTSLSLFSLITTPLNSLFQSAPQFMSAMASLARVQTYLTSNTFHEKREVIAFAEKSEKGSAAGLSDEDLAVEFDNLNFGWDPAGGMIIQDASFRTFNTQLVIVVGPVASGKSSLLKAILGETPISTGTVRVSTLRMSFCDQTPWFMNTTIRKIILGFSELDTHWYNEVLHACALEDDLAQLPAGDQSRLGSNGITLSGGQKQRLAIARAVYAREDIAIFDDVFHGLDSITTKRIFSRVFGNDGLLRRNKTTVFLATHEVHLLPQADHIIVLDSTGRIAQQGNFEALVAGEGYIQDLSVQAEKEQGPKEDVSIPSTTEPSIEQQVISGRDATDAAARTNKDLEVYRYYFSSMDVWLGWWSDATPGETPKFIGVYALLQVLSLLALYILAWYTLMVVVSKSGIKLHTVLLHTTMMAPMSFFNTVDTGVTLNRFSQDITIIDSELPLSLLNTVANALMCLARAILIIPSSYWLVIAYPVMFGILYVIQTYYLRTSKQLRLLDIESRSTLYTNFIETVTGITTIRAFGWKKQLNSLNYELLDDSQKPYHLMFSVQRWLNLVLDLTIAGLSIILVALSLQFRTTANAGFTGVALYNLMGLGTSMKAAIKSWTALEMAIGAISRIKAYEDHTLPENLPGENDLPPEGWPASGNIQFNNVTTSYFKEGGNNAYTDLSLSIKAGEKIGICGRSGSGKSSLILTLARMLEMTQGSIIVDGIDLANVLRSDVRSRFNIIPQEPYFLEGTVRLNADPQNAQSDQEIIKALESVQLWDQILEKGGLDAEMDAGWLSHGQRQLFCLARAFLHHSKIVILDEATSSVDKKTDEQLQQVIQDKFQNHTVIAVAHRLDTILNFDRIAVLDKGVMVECDTPAALLARDSMFRDLWASNHQID